MDSSIVKMIFRALWVVLITVVIILSLYFLTPLVYPFIIGWLIAYMLNPIVNLLQRKARFPRWLASTVTIMVFLGIFITVITLLISKIVVEISKFIQMINNNMNGWIAQIVEFTQSETIQSYIDQVSMIYMQNERFHETIESNLIGYGEKLSVALTNLLTSTVEYLISLVAGLPNFALIIVVVLLAAFFMSKDWYKLARKIKNLFPSKIADTTSTLWNGLRLALFGYLRAQLIMISITGLFIICGMLIMNIKYAITIGLIIALVDLLPYLGVGAIMVPWIAFLIIQGNYPLAIGLGVLYGIVLIVRSIIEPKVLATSIGLDALSTLIAMVVGLNLFGISGVIIGPVLLVIAVAIFRARVPHNLLTYIRNGPEPKIP